MGRNFAFVYHKHPPLMGWVAASWTFIFPVSDLSLQLMAMVNAGLALFFVDCIARQFVTGHKRILVLLLLMLTPAYQFHAQRFNANAVLLATWPLATWCFLRAFETRSVFWAVAAGCATALAMVGKYYSIFLVASFALAALAHPARRDYLTSASPWISVVTGVAVLSPHVYWLATTGASTFDYALAHANGNALSSIDDVTNFLLGLIAAVSVAAVIWVLISGTRLKQFPADFVAMSPGLRLLFYVAIGTIVLPVLTSLAMGTDLPSLWALQGLFLFIVLVVCGARYPIERFYTVNVTVIVAGVALVAILVAAPIHATYRNVNGYEEARNLYAQAASELTRQWHELTGESLKAVSGDDSLAFATAFYSPDHPHYARPFEHQSDWGLPRKTTLDRGWAALCFKGQDYCGRWMEWVSSRAGTFVRREFTVQAQLWGRPGLSREVVVLMVPPRANADAPSESAAEEFGASKRSPD
ncbi:glycosyltransferase family 39 protein [Bradyrhizobium sp. CCBAU 45384]|uniref:glycosyltransferase family 39 protein n=1 Tax=Bradyrhizobium sp. CCBAU 45384 TaxID=858428 RepID=UPI003FA4D4AE